MKLLNKKVDAKKVTFTALTEKALQQVKGGEPDLEELILE